jgi:hypothetical protein
MLKCVCSNCGNVDIKYLQHWDLVKIFGWDYFQGQITKYVMRWRDKNGIQDLDKAAHFLQKYSEIEYEGEEAGPGYVNQDPTTPERQSMGSPLASQYDQFSRPGYDQVIGPGGRVP